MLFRYVCCVVFLVGCSRVVNRVSDEKDICEALFRYEFTRFGAPTSNVYFLAIGDPKGVGGKDPDEAILGRFTTHTPRIARRSEATYSLQDGATDTKTHESGIIFYAGAVRWISDLEVEIAGGYVEAGRSAAGYTYVLKWKWGRWVVDRTQIQWIA